ncbi:MAG: PEP-CTERM sorting domain-containing protein [Planctomycetota bacterium]
MTLDRRRGKHASNYEMSFESPKHSPADLGDPITFDLPGPEPTSLALLGPAGLTLAARRRRA